MSGLNTCGDIQCVRWLECRKCLKAYAASFLCSSGITATDISVSKLFLCLFRYKCAPLWVVVEVCQLPS